MNNKLLKISLIISLVGIGLLYLILITSSVPFIDASKINEEHIGKTIKSEIQFSSLKDYNNSKMIYSKKINIRLLIFTDQKINIENESVIEFTGIVDEDKYGLYVIVDNMDVRKIK